MKFTPLLQRTVIMTAASLLGAMPLAAAPTTAPQKPAANVAQKPAAARAKAPGNSVAEPIPAQVDVIKVQPDKAPDCSSLQSIVDSVTRGCKTNDDKAIAIYNFMILTHYHCPYPSEPGGVPALKVVNCYGFSLCGGLHTVESALWITAGWDHRYVGWSNPGHTTVEAFYDNKWHYLDAFLKFYAWKPDPSAPNGRTIAGEDDLAKDPEGLIMNNFVLDKARKVVYAKDNQFVMNGDHANWEAPAFLSCEDPLTGVVTGVKSKHTGGAAAGWAGINHDTGSYDTNVNLAPGYALTVAWEPVQGAWYWTGKPAKWKEDGPAHSCPSYKDTRNDPAYGLIVEPYFDPKTHGKRTFADATLSFTPDLSDANALKSFVSSSNVQVADGALAPVNAGQPAEVVLQLASPYILTRANGSADGELTAEVSVDGGKTFNKVEYKDFTDAVKGAMAAQVKLTFTAPVKNLKVDALAQENPGSLPYLSPGKNMVHVSVGDATKLGDNKLVVTYAYQLGYRTKSFEQLCDEGAEIAKGHNAKWADTVTYVQKAFTAKDLPADFEVDCPTPKGMYAVYPRMVLMRREVIAPNEKPLPLPEGAQEPKSNPDDQMLEYPNPFLIGTQPPPAIKPVATRTISIPLNYVEFADKDGVSEKNVLSWPKDDKAQVTKAAIIVAGDVKELPKRINAARLVIPVTTGNKNANTKVAAVFLKHDPQAGQPVDFATLDSTAGSTVVPKQPEATPTYDPAKPFSVDVTKEIKLIANGEAQFHGIALRVLPDRGTDDGFTVRATLAKTPFTLEVDEIIDSPAPDKSASK